MKCVVKYTESERGWGGEVWYTAFETELEAFDAIEECNKDLPKETPGYYIIASYEGKMEVLPKGYKF